VATWRRRDRVAQRQQVHRRLHGQPPRGDRHRGRVDQPVKAVTAPERHVVAGEHPVDPGRLDPGREVAQARRPAGQLVRQPQADGELGLAWKVSHRPFGMKTFSTERTVVHLPRPVSVSFSPPGRL
jgi:hypothetical protein